MIGRLGLMAGLWIERKARREKLLILGENFCGVEYTWGGLLGNVCRSIGLVLVNSRKHILIAPKTKSTENVFKKVFFAETVLDWKEVEQKKFKFKHVH